MPLWKIYHPVGAFSLEDKKGLSEAITALYARGLPKFYVGVVFQEVAADSFFIGGESVDNFVRIWIDHIARTMPTAEIRAKFIEMADAALAPYVRDRGLNWEYHIDETSYELWSIQGYRPPLPGTPDEIRWRTENQPSPVGPRETV
ncbi:phenylpyruvate tautomerase PptA (4-oxalocrotonate tautomerase family) [Phenylobacterium haematophilum]|uniref:Phenylpyruvate tautomerase PptA (4-oxalocrotonate tautomerase family) n=1 Tax=Phenylobacterium haematophilum TaxID=98513 RepID=A0A839ZYA5_9CAUL|nr:tautomerase family protein [Phenylobacterium haematophilum]MBB3891346.1 phenylpyruvate tautomerase PptA (4-oxalocrotonate tautomerase family) [Phenylobacterium haematophilum]